MAPAGDRRIPQGDDSPHHRLPHEDARQGRHVARARDVPGRVQPVGTDEVRVRQAELPRALVHHRDEAGLISLPDVVGQRPGGVVGALNEARFDEVAHGELFPGAEADRRLPDLRRFRWNGDDVVEPGLLEREQNGHELRDAGDRHLAARVPGEQHVSGAPVLDDIRAGVHARSRGEGRGNDREDSREGQQPLHGLESTRRPTTRRGR